MAATEGAWRPHECVVEVEHETVGQEGDGFVSRESLRDRNVENQGPGIELPFRLEVMQI